MTHPLYPMLLQPVLHTRVWGGRKLATALGKTLPDDQPYGESWEMHDTAVIANGPLAGHTIAEALSVLGTDLCGAGFDPPDGMPLLLKFLDAEDWLSVQVHPDDDHAAALEGDPRGKTEAWFVLAAEPDARLVIGVKAGTTPDALRDAIAGGALEPLLEYAPVKTGDMLFVSAGTIHALGPGLLIYEIQQSSDITYRCYDWGRLGLDGKPRTLHVEKSLHVAHIGRLPEIRKTAHLTGATVVILRSRYFDTVQHRLGGGYSDSVSLSTDGRFQIITSIDGTAEISARGELIALGRGQTALLPAALGAYDLLALDDAPARVLRSHPGEGA